MLEKALAAISALLLTLVTLTLVVLLGTLTHSDAVGYLDGVDGAKLTRPLPGQLYVVSAEGKIDQQLCEIEELAFEIDRLSGWTFVNRLGETVPAVFGIVAPYLQPGQEEERAFAVSYRLEWHGLDHQFATAEDLNMVTSKVLQDDGCFAAIKEAFRGRLEVCQLKEVFREATGGRPLAVRFRPRCLALKDDDPRPLPELAAGSFWTSVKLGMGLVHELRPAAMIAGNGAG